MGKVIRKMSLFLLISIVFVTSCSNSGGKVTKDTSYPIQGGAVLQAFCWSFNTIAENIPQIAEAGFTAVQTSPITECIAGDASAPGKPSGNQLNGDGAWWFGYQPVSFRIGNYQLGTEEEFAEMCKVANKHGVKIIVDAVLNHMAAMTNRIDKEFRNLPGGGVRPRMAMGDTRLQQTQGRLLGLTDLNTHNPLVQQEALRFLQRAAELGASGFRYDAVFCIEKPDEYEEELRSDFWPVVLANGTEFQYGEILGVAEANQYVSLMNVTDATYGHDIVDALRSQELKARRLSGYNVTASASQLVTWVESHDTYCNEGITADLTTKQILYGWAIIAARNGSTPLYFSRPEGSYPGHRWGNNIIGERGNDDFMKPEVSAVNHFKRAMEGSEERLSNPTKDLSLLMIERGGSGAVIVNMGAQVSFDNVETQLLADGQYTDKISGNLFIVADGKLSGDIMAESIIVIY